MSFQGYLLVAVRVSMALLGFTLHHGGYAALKGTFVSELPKKPSWAMDESST